MQHPPKENRSFSKYICRGQGHLSLHLCSSLLSSCCPATPPNVPAIHGSELQILSYLKQVYCVLLVCPQEVIKGWLLGSGFFYLCVLGAIMTAGFNLGLSCTRSLVANQCCSIKGDLASS